MPTDYVVDAHALVWFLEGNRRLGAHAKAALENPDSRLFVPIIAIAEACWVIQSGETSIGSIPEFLAAIDGDRRFTILPLDREVLAIHLQLARPSEMHDRLIAATVLSLQKEKAVPPLITRDQELTETGFFPIMW